MTFGTANGGWVGEAGDAANASFELRQNARSALTVYMTVNSTLALQWASRSAFAASPPTPYPAHPPTTLPAITYRAGRC
jgi:hypothetical protein